MRSAKRRRGQTALLFTLAVLPLMGMVGLAVDIGTAYYRRQAAQTAADAAASAAALSAYQAGAGAPTCGTAGVACYAGEFVCPASLPAVPVAPSDNIIAGCMYARENGFRTQGRQRVTLRSGTGAPDAQPNVGSSYWVTLRVQEEVPQFFSVALGNTTAVVAATATAAVFVSNGGGGCIYILNPSSTGIAISGNATVQSACGIQVNSRSAAAVVMSGNAVIRTTGEAQTKIHGNYVRSGNAVITPAPVLNAPAVPDPYESVTEPSDPGGGCLNTSISSQGRVTLNPGVYCSLNISSDANVTFAPGVYVLRSGMNISGQPVLNGSGVTFYNRQGSINISGGAAINLSAPTSGELEGFIIFQSRTNSSSLNLSGGASQMIGGAVYAKAGVLNYSGNGNSSGIKTTLVVDRVNFSGNAYINQPAVTAVHRGSTGGVGLVD